MSIADDDVRDRLRIGPRVPAKPLAPTPEDVVERVARGLCKHQSLNPDEEIFGHPRWHGWMRQAEAAIAAMPGGTRILDARAKGDIADSITIEGRSKTDVVQDVWDELVQRGLVREQKREIVDKATLDRSLQSIKYWAKAAAIAEDIKDMRLYAKNAQNHVENLIAARSKPEIEVE